MAMSSGWWWLWSTVTVYFVSVHPNQGIVHTAEAAPAHGTIPYVGADAVCTELASPYVARGMYDCKNLKGV
jgi:hypothetical protein